ncbi:MULTISPECIES: sigma factor-like helix-turn-helix DNA-binding protein [unclassified Pseudonocardia]|uniref:sigma factor-like helix-turn-helix DNA-binding protein n=1 Tax=unclassified Pseudonocardia TaxID=2619320 RepID=UPI001CF660CA|nr:MULTISPECIES: helix-turn-helix domain-containing protein [unclassified Pseudonocardia]
MTAQIPKRRTKSARDLAEQFGVTRATVVRMMAEPRDDYERRARQRRAAAVQLRLQGLTYREIAERLGTSIGSVGHVLYTARRNGDWAAAVARHTADHAE